MPMSTVKSLEALGQVNTSVKMVVRERPIFKK